MKSINVRRGQAIEQENGDLHCSLIIEREHRDAFFSIAGAPGDWLSISPYVVAGKPPAQSVSPVGTSDGTVGPVGALVGKEAKDALALCNNPWFQQFAEARLGRTVNSDSVATARVYVGQAVLVDGKWNDTSTALYRTMIADYTDWCRLKGYTNG